MRRLQRHHQIASELADGDEYQKRGQSYPQDAGEDGKRIADDRQPGKEQRPQAETAEPYLGALQRLPGHRKPGLIGIADEEAAETPVYRRAEDIADRGDGHQHCRLLPAGGEQRGQRQFRRTGKQCGRKKCRSKQTGVDCEVLHVQTLGFREYDSKRSGFARCLHRIERKVPRRCFSAVDMPVRKVLFGATVPVASRLRFPPSMAKVRSIRPIFGTLTIRFSEL